MQIVNKELYIDSDVNPGTTLVFNREAARVSHMISRDHCCDEPFINISWVSFKHSIQSACETVNRR